MATQAPKPQSKWIKGIGAFALGSAILSVGGGFIAATAMRYDLVDKLAGFGWMFRSLPVGVVAVLVGLVVLIVALIRRTGPKWQALAAIGLVLAYFGVIATQVVAGLGAPPMHDVTTDIDDPPQFQAITLPENNLRGFASEGEWQAAHRQFYPEVKPVIVDEPPQAVLEKARAIALANGWTLVDFDLDAGRMEAIAYASYVRFHDFVLVEVTPIEDGSTRVDMRSTSEVGVGDIGYNAARIRDFLADLQAG